MSNDEQYIGSMSPTIGVKEHRELLQVTKQVGFLLTQEEFAKIMAVYMQTLDRVFKENGLAEVEDED